MLGCCTINIGWLTSLVDSSVNLVMSLVSHGSLYIHLVHHRESLDLCQDFTGLQVVLSFYCLLLMFFLELLLVVLV